MIVPQYWAEARLQHRHRNRQVTVRRFGWSDTGEQDAQAHAETRAREALDRILAGESLARREPKRAYNGAEGVPIREQIVSRHGPVVITRNSYGALCLNTPDVLFADIDFPEQPGLGLACGMFAGLALTAVVLGWRTHSWFVPKIVLVILAALLFLNWLAILLRRALSRLRGGPEAIARARIDRFLDDHRDWHVRLYRTPAGLRLLALHRTFAPDDPEVAACFEALAVDPVYARMCRNQQCFRARVSPKPWRIGIADHIRPRTRAGVWPVRDDLRPIRDQWIAAYDQAARAHSSCALIDDLGSAATHPEALRVQQLHDDLCRATSGLPLA